MPVLRAGLPRKQHQFLGAVAVVVDVGDEFEALHRQPVQAHVGHLDVRGFLRRQHDACCFQYVLGSLLRCLNFGSQSWLLPPADSIVEHNGMRAQAEVRAVTQCFANYSAPPASGRIRGGTEVAADRASGAGLPSDSRYAISASISSGVASTFGMPPAFIFGAGIMQERGQPILRQFAR